MSPVPVVVLLAVGLSAPVPKAKTDAELTEALVGTWLGNSPPRPPDENGVRLLLPTRAPEFRFTKDGGCTFAPGSLHLAPARMQETESGTFQVVDGVLTMKLKTWADSLGIAGTAPGKPRPVAEPRTVTWTIVSVSGTEIVVTDASGAKQKLRRQPGR